MGDIDRKKLKVAFLSSEVVPYAKTGGLADVSGTLPVELKRAGVGEILVFMPAYREAKESRNEISKECEISFDFCGKRTTAGFMRGKLSDYVDIILIENDEYYDREGLYVTPNGDYPDNAQRFSFFSLASLYYMKQIELHPHIIHCNDWQTSLVPIFLKTTFSDDDNFKNTAVCLTVHNLAYQGNFSFEQISPLNIPPEYLTEEALKHYDSYSFLKGGLIFSTVVNTVSRKYSKEIQTPEFGCGMENILKNRSKTVFGILNGVDYSQWNPETDKLIPFNYSAEKLEGKKKCKEVLQKNSKLDISPEIPLLGIVSRLAYQKGIDILAETIPEIVDAGGQVVVLGTGEARYEEALRKRASEFKRAVSVTIGFDNELAHLIEAGCDFFLMPSRYEPCGLNQMYSLKYGTIPIVRATGGLDDTIIDFDKDMEQGNGFKFEELTPSDFFSAIKRALNCYSSSEWNKIIENAMRCDFSWRKSAEEYIKLYKTALAIEGVI